MSNRIWGSSAAASRSSAGHRRGQASIRRNRRELAPAPLDSRPGGGRAGAGRNSGALRHAQLASVRSGRGPEHRRRAASPRLPGPALFRNERRALHEKCRCEASGVELKWATSYHDEPLLIDAFAERLQDLRGKVLFTAHSLPAPNEQYDREARATALAVATRLGLADWEFAYQSQGMSGGTWLGPTVESCLDRYAVQGVHEVVLAPIGFVCDHVEILYDIDVLFRAYAAERNIVLTRPESLNGSPTFTAALAEVVKRCL